jgi:cell wall assembly regulator SMI1
MAGVTDAWARIEGWMLRHAAVSAEMLAGPADPAAIAAAEAELGLAFPAELTESLLRHDGLVDWANVLPEAVPLSTAGIVEHRQMRMDIAEDVDGFVAHREQDEPWWHELWLPFADADGDLQVVDLRPGPGYLRLGFAPHDNPAHFDDAWPSLGDYLSAVAHALETSSEAGEWFPYLTVDGELWWSLPGETELNGEPLRPAPPG